MPTPKSVLVSLHPILSNSLEIGGEVLGMSIRPSVQRDKHTQECRSGFVPLALGHICLSCGWADDLLQF